MPEPGPVPAPEPFAVRLKPGANGEFTFDIRDANAQDLHVGPPPTVVAADLGIGVPPQLYSAVNEILGFVYGLDHQVGQKKAAPPATRGTKPLRKGER